MENSIERLNAIPSDTNVVYIVYSPQGCKSYRKESIIYLDKDHTTLLEEDVPTETDHVYSVGKLRSEFSILIQYGPWDVYNCITSETGKYRNIYYFLKNYVTFPPTCEIVLVRNGIEERYPDTESMPDDDPLQNTNDYVTLFPDLKIRNIFLDETA